MFTTSLCLLFNATPLLGPRPSFLASSPPLLNVYRCSRYSCCSPASATSNEAGGPAVCHATPASATATAAPCCEHPPFPPLPSQLQRSLSVVSSWVRFVLKPQSLLGDDLKMNLKVYPIGDTVSLLPTVHLISEIDFTTGWANKSCPSVCALKLLQ